MEITPEGLAVGIFFNALYPYILFADQTGSGGVPVWRWPTAVNPPSNQRWGYPVLSF
jgi:hypothetical protein